MSVYVWYDREQKILVLRPTTYIICFVLYYTVIEIWKNGLSFCPVIDVQWVF